GNSFDSSLKDFILPVPVSIGNCDIAIAKDVVKVNGVDALNPASVNQGDTVTYRITLSLGPGSKPIPLGQIGPVTDTVGGAVLRLVALRDAANNIVGDTNDNEILDPGEQWEYGLTSNTPVTQTAAACADLVDTVKVSLNSVVVMVPPPPPPDNGDNHSSSS